MKHLTLLLFIALLFNLSFSQESILPNTIVVKYKESLSHKNQNTAPQFILNTLGYSNIKSHKAMFHWHSATNRKSNSKLANIYLIEIGADQKLGNYIRELNKLNEIEYAHPYYLPELLGEVNDPLNGSQYYLSIIKAFEAHEITKGDTNIVVGIVDTGLDLLHPDLINNIKYNYNDPINGIDDDMDNFVDNFRGWDIADGDNNPSRFYSSHGTMVAGLAAATCNNEVGIYSIGYNTKVLPIKIMDNRGYLSGGYQGIVYAADHGCQIINCSWGSQIQNPLCEDVINYAVNEKNCLVVAAAGNARTNIPYYPAACKGVLNVANTNRSDNKSSKSTFGVEVDICAPGEQVLTTFGAQGYTQGWGTSFAAPIVSGTAALVKAMHPEYTGLQIGEQLRITADIIDTLPNNLYFHRHMGRGRLNAFNALTNDTLPSLRVTEYLLKGDNSTFLPGDTLQTTFSITNYLSQITNTIVQLTIESDFAETINNTFQTGMLGTLESVNNDNKPMQIIIHEDAPYDETVELDFKFNGYGYDDYQIFKTLINPSFININIHNIETSLTSNGRIGFANSQTILGKGLIYNNQTNLLPNSGIIIGNARDNVASSLIDVFDFDIVSVIDSASINDEYFVGKTSFKCGEKYNSLPVLINQESRIYYKDKLSDVVFHSYSVINESNTDISDFAFSVFTNFDIDYNRANTIEYEKSHNLFYTKSTRNSSTYAGVALLSQDTCVPYAFDLVLGGNGGVDITNGFSDDQKWFAMNNPRYDDGNLVDTINVASMLSSKKEILLASDTLKYTYCFVIADTYYDLLEKTRLAKEELFPPIIEGLAENKLSFEIFPNPTSSDLNFRFKNNTQLKTIQLYNNQGKLIENFTTQQEYFSLKGNSYKTGVYFVKVTEGNALKTKKVVFIK